MLCTPMERYLADVEANLLVADVVQKAAVARLECCFQSISQRHQENNKKVNEQNQSVFQKIWDYFFGNRAQNTASSALGCYLWGGVGRGKTHIMDYFYESVLGLGLRAKRTHFHRFMREIHEALHRLRGVSEPLDIIADEYVKLYDVICLDEFVVIDITDAMLLGGLTLALFQRNIILVTTSNVAPKDLYKDGLQRSQFLPTIANIERYLDVFHLASSNDYRLRHLEGYQTYKVLDNALDDDECLEHPLRVLYEELVNEAPKQGKITINRRQIPYQAMHNDVVWFQFSNICGDQRSVADYIEIAQEFHTVLLSGVPVLKGRLEEQARRFIHLIDEFYDCKVRVFITAKAPIDALYQGQKLAFEFERTQSRLVEMQSQAYLGYERLANV